MDIRTATTGRLQAAARAGARARAELRSRAATITATTEPASQVRPEDDVDNDEIERTGNPGDEVSFGVRVAALWAVSFIAIVAGLIVLVWLLNEISLVTITLTIAIMLSALLAPMVSLLQRLHVPRVLAVIVVFVGGIAVISFLTWFVISQIAYNKDTLVSQLGGAATNIREWLINGPLKMKPTEADKYTTNLSQTLNDHGVGVGSAVQTASSAVGVLSGGVLCLFSTLFFMLDDGSIWRWVVRLFPVHSRRHVRAAGLAGWRTLTAYMRSLVLLAILNAAAMVPFMMWAGIPLVVPLAVLLFLGSLVPMIGVLVAGVIMCLVAFVTQGVTTALLLGLALVVVIQVFGNVVNPIILGKAVSIHPLVILAGVTGGTLLAGMFGAFVGVPLIAVANNAIHAMRQPPGSTVTTRAEVHREGQADVG